MSVDKSNHFSNWMNVDSYKSEIFRLSHPNVASTRRIGQALYIYLSYNSNRIVLFKSSLFCPESSPIDLGIALAKACPSLAIWASLLLGLIFIWPYLNHALCRLGPILTHLNNYSAIHHIKFEGGVKAILDQRKIQICV